MSRSLRRNRTVFLNDAEQALYGGLPLTAPSHDEQRPPRAVSVSDIWFEHAIDAHWVAAYRLGLQQQDTQIVVAEIRVFPSAEPRTPQTGRWSADVLGSHAAVPAGGIQARTVLRKIRLRAFERELSAFLKHVPFARFRAPAPTRGARGRKRDLRRYARVAIVYAEACAALNSRPTAAVARRLRLSAAAARSAVATARRLGLLTKTTRGERSGRATPRAFEIENQAAPPKGTTR